MSMDFTVNFSGPFRDLAELLFSAEQNLGGAGLRRSSAFIRASYDDRRGVFDEVDEDDELLDFDSLSALKERVSAWQGASATYQAEGFHIYTLIGITSGAATHCWVDISERKLRQMAMENEEGRFYAALGAVATTCAAVGAFGLVERPFEPMMPNQIVEAILGSSETTFDPPDLGLINRGVISLNDLKAISGSRYRISDWPNGYWLLEECEWYLKQYLGKTEP